MERQRSDESLKKRLPKILKWVLAIGALYELSLFAADEIAKNIVLERANGTCEGCGKQNLNGTGIVGHLNHARGENYNNPNNLLFHCFQCEALHHLKHVGNAKKIGLREQDNNASALGRLVELIINDSAEFEIFYHKHQPEIDLLFKKLKVSYSQFIRSYSSY
ncbi:MAG: hypothetical protein ABII10_03305 [Candidatus Paceibacterota bacterium]